MGGPAGNKHWMFRVRTGAPRVFADKEEFAEALNDYFTYVIQNPLKEAVIQKVKTASGEKVKIFSVPKMRAMSIKGFCAFAGCAVSTFYETEKRDGFSELAESARNIFFSQKFEGAAAGLLSQSIVAQELGLVSKTEQTVFQYQPVFDDSDPGNKG